MFELTYDYDDEKGPGIWAYLVQSDVQFIAPQTGTPEQAAAAAEYARSQAHE